MRTEPQLLEALQTLRVQEHNLRGFLNTSLEREDLHGVEDAASDLRDLRAAKKALKWALAHPDNREPLQV